MIFIKFIIDNIYIKKTTLESLSFYFQTLIFNEWNYQKYFIHREHQVIFIINSNQNMSFAEKLSGFVNFPHTNSNTVLCRQQ